MGNSHLPPTFHKLIKPFFNPRLTVSTRLVVPILVNIIDIQNCQSMDLFHFTYPASVMI